MATTLLQNYPGVFNETLGLSDSQRHELCEKLIPDDNNQGDTVAEETADIFTAAKSGLLVLCQDIVIREGSQVLNQYDAKGSNPIHWAALKGNLHALRYFIECNGPVNEPVRNEGGQRPIHLACANGHLACVAFLLESGVPIDTTDGKGSSPLIVAAQFHQTVIAGYLVGKGADVRHVDHEGDTALHWAACRGHCEMVKLMLYCGLDPAQTDDYRQTALHQACISGDVNTVEELCAQKGVREITYEPDVNGKTPVMLAQGRQHVKVIHFLTNKQPTGLSIITDFQLRYILFGPPSNMRVIVTLFLINLFFYAYPVYFTVILPVLLNEFLVPNLILILMSIVMVVTYICSWLKDPGFLSLETDEYRKIISEIGNIESTETIAQCLTRLCHTCRIVKPLRSKHCRNCNRCIRNFDHHCPYIGNCVGFNNRHFFMLFIGSANICGPIALYLGFYYLRYIDWSYLVFIGTVEMVILYAIVFFVNIFAWKAVLINMTVNEQQNYKRYDYMKNAVGTFSNPYNRSPLTNCMEYFHILPQEDDTTITRRRGVFLA